MILKQAEPTPETDSRSPPPSEVSNKGSKKWSRRAMISAFCVTLFLGASGLLVVDAAMAPLSTPGFCTSCHEMEDQHASWTASPHHTNASGVTVTCVQCHLTPKERWVAHTADKCWTGTKHAAVHYFGAYDAEASRKLVLDTMPNQRCLNCHSNLMGAPSSQPVGIVHDTSLKCAEDRTHACVACHDSLHGPKVVPEKKSFEAGDNSYCLVCHIDFEEETFAVCHVKAGISCIDCHGDSDEHAEDEEHLNAPSILYAKAKVNASCTTSDCHPKPKMEAEIGHRPFFADATPEQQYCTDCHGKHRKAKRTRRWDKEKRILIEFDGREVKPGEVITPSGDGGGMM